MCVCVCVRVNEWCMPMNGSLHMRCGWLGKCLVLVHAMWKYALVAWVHVLMWVLECMNVWVHVWVHGRGACACIDVCIGACLLGCVCGCMAKLSWAFS